MKTLFDLKWHPTYCPSTEEAYFKSDEGYRCQYSTAENTLFIPSKQVSNLYFAARTIKLVQQDAKSLYDSIVKRL
jgi:hypothetical protein